MNVIKLNCSACGAPISVPDDLDYINCASCGSFLAIERGEGYVALKIAEKIARAIEDSGKGTQDVIRQSAQVTRSELQRLQLTQEISAARMQLANIQSEIRALQRAPSTPAGTSQMKNLRFLEYEAMDRVRLAELRVAELGPQDPATVNHNAEKELDWIAKEIQALNQTNFPQRKQALAALSVRKTDLEDTVLEIKVQELKKKLASFRVEELPTKDPFQAAEFLKIASEDEVKLRIHKNSPEGKVVYQKLSERKQIVRQAWERMEKERIDLSIKSPGYTYDQNNLFSLTEHLNIIDRDLAVLSAGPDNEIVQSYRKTLLAEKNNIQKRIQKLAAAEAKAVKRNTVEAQTDKTGILTGFFLGFTAFFAGIALLAKSLFARSPAQQTIPSVPIEGVSDVGISGASSGTSATGQVKGDLKPLGKGCLFGFLYIFGFFILAGVALLSMLPDTPTSSPDASMGVFFLIITIGFVLGARSFLRNVAPGTRIQGIAGKLELVLTNSKSPRGIKNLPVVKALAGMIAWILVYLLALTLFGFLSSGDSTLPGLIIFVGLIAGPVAAVFVSQRTSLGAPTVELNG